MKQLAKNLDLFACPKCKGDLEIAEDSLSCSQCNNCYPVENGIPLLFWPHEPNSTKRDVTEIVKTFYEKTPFPNYENFENIGDLVRKAQEGIFARLLNEQVSFGIKVLEIGCGTGQLSNFLGIAHRYVFGVDMCLNSLKLAQGFKEKNNLDRVSFCQMNLFKPTFKAESFPLVICNGVLHHTGDPFTGFQSISRLVKKDGYIIIGLYNKYGRLITDIRRMIFSKLNNRFKFLDPRLRHKTTGELKKLTWFMDQYKNPHESKHTVGEVLRWFNLTGFNFINSIPSLKPFKRFSASGRIFEPNPRGNWFHHFLAQSGTILSGSREGGLFLMIGKKR